MTILIAIAALYAVLSLCVSARLIDSEAQIPLCNERMELNIGIQATEVDTVRVKFNEENIAESKRDPKSNDTWITSFENNEYNGGLTISCTGGIIVTVKQLSDIDNVTYKFVITYKTGEFMKIDLQLTFKLNRYKEGVYKITYLPQKTPQDLLQQEEEFVCGNSTINCFLMAEIFKCVQSIPVTKSMKGEMRGLEDMNCTGYIIGMITEGIVLAVTITALGCCCYIKRGKRTNADIGDINGDEGSGYTGDAESAHQPINDTIAEPCEDDQQQHDDNRLLQIDERTEQQTEQGRLKRKRQNEDSHKVRQLRRTESRQSTDC